MSDQQLKKTLTAMKQLQREHKASPEAARAFLRRAGILTKSGKLAKHLRQGA